MRAQQVKRSLQGIEITPVWLAQVLSRSLIWCVTLYVGITRAVTCQSLKRVTGLECETILSFLLPPKPLPPTIPVTWVSDVLWGVVNLAGSTISRFSGKDFVKVLGSRDFQDGISLILIRFFKFRIFWD